MQIVIIDSVGFRFKMNCGHLDDGKDGLDLVFQHFESAGEFALDFVQLAFFVVVVGVVVMAGDGGGQRRRGRVRPYGPTPKGPDAVAQFGAIAVMVDVDGQKPCKQFLTVREDQMERERERKSREDRKQIRYKQPEMRVKAPQCRCTTTTTIKNKTKNNNNNPTPTHTHRHKPWLMRLGRDGKVADGRDSGGNVFAIDIETQRPCGIRRLGRNDFQAVLHFGPVKTTKTQTQKIKR